MTLTHGGILIAQSILLILAVIAIVKLVFDLMQSNQEVVKLFAYVQPHEIVILRRSCLNFIQDNLCHFLDEKEKNILLADNKIGAGFDTPLAASRVYGANKDDNLMNYGIKINKNASSNDLDAKKERQSYVSLDKISY